jgi:hypothetical protein
VTSGTNLCARLEGENLFTALYGVYMISFMDLKAVLKNSTEKTGKEKALAIPTHEGFQELIRKRRSSTEGDRPNSVKKKGTNNHKDTRLTTATTTTRNFFAHLRDLEMDAAPGTGGVEADAETLQRTGKDRPPAIIITSQINLLKFQGDVEGHH